MRQLALEAVSASDVATLGRVAKLMALRAAQDMGALALVVYENAPGREAALKLLERTCREADLPFKSAEIPLHYEGPVVDWLLKEAEGAGILAVLHLERVFDEGLAEINLRRQELRDARLRALFLLRPEHAGRLANGAPDFWRYLHDTGRLDTPWVPDTYAGAVERGAGFRYASAQEAMADLERIEEYLADTDNRSDLLGHRLRLLAQKIEALTFLGRIPEAANMARALAQDRDLDSALSPGQVAEILRACGRAYWEAAQYGRARELSEKALALHEQSLGPNHPEVAEDLVDVGLAMKRLGDLAGARRHYERALAIHEAALGPDHPQVAAGLNNLSVILRDLGDLEGARERLERALAIDEAALGPHHPEVATDLNNLGGILRDLGDLAVARQHLERALAIHEAALGLHHPEVATDLHNLGLLLADLGDLQGAREDLERALSILSQSLGAHHPKTRAVAQNLALLPRAKGASASIAE